MLVNRSALAMPTSVLTMTDVAHRIERLLGPVRVVREALDVQQQAHLHNNKKTTALHRHRRRPV